METLMQQRRDCGNAFSGGHRHMHGEGINDDASVRSVWLYMYSIDVPLTPVGCLINRVIYPLCNHFQMF